VVFLDITASRENRGLILDVIRRAADQLFLPLTVGGGIRTLEDIQQILRAGADKVPMNTSAVNDPPLINRAAERFGTQCTVVAIDVRRRLDDFRGKTPVPLPGGSACWYEVVTYGGSKPTGIDAMRWAVETEERGAGEILLTSMETDGTKAGFDIPGYLACGDFNKSEIRIVAEPDISGSILKHPKDFEMLREAIETVAAEKGKSRLALYTYFADAAPLFDKLLSLPVDAIGLDFTYSPKLPRAIETHGCDLDIGLGLINGRNTRLEKLRDVQNMMRRILPVVGSERVYLNPSCGLGDFLPREVAYKKLENMVAIAEKIKGMMS
jgi:phosphoribosylformimino-5-aminoimidazole carboxamide ribonucleotide (ProFAR) isomerase